ncbi:MAG TPA: hypothetical protein VM939_07205 [Gemmatimonadaceae bacterium]|nr:hypothetical protein [Gemmatimonadaceae bacterium]
MSKLRWGLVPRSASARDAGLITVVSSIAFFIGALAWPLFPGRDAQTYLMYYLEMSRADPVFPLLMLFRTPGAPLFFGPPLAVGAPVLAELMLWICYVIALLAVYACGSFWSRRVGVTAAVIVALYPNYNALYHQVSSDGLFAFAVAVWTLLFCATAFEPTRKKYVGLGAFIFVLLMIRPASLLFFAFLALVVVVARESGARKLRHGGIAVGVAALLVIGWAGYNKLRYDDFTVSRLAPTNVPLFRLHSIDHLIKPENGPASRSLSDAIQRDLLTREPYRSYGVTLDYFLKHGRTTMWADLAPLSDRVWGWDTDYRVLRAASREAIARHPLAYGKGVASTTMKFLTGREYPPRSPKPPSPRSIRCEITCVGEGTVIRNGRVLPAPYYPDETIPVGHSYWLESSPDRSIATDWSDISNPRLTFKTPEMQNAFVRLSSDLHQMMLQLPPRRAITGLPAVANVLADLLPSMLIWLMLGLAGLFRVRRGRLIMLCLPVMALAFIGVTALGLPAHPAYRLPFDPLLILFGVAGFFGTRSSEGKMDDRYQPSEDKELASG